MAEGTSWLPASGRYRLEILSRGARVYHPQDRQIQALAKRGFVEPLEAPMPDGTHRWTITDAGRSMLTRHAEAGSQTRSGAR